MTAHDPDHQKVARSSRMDGVCARVCACAGVCRTGINSSSSSPVSRHLVGRLLTLDSDSLGLYFLPRGRGRRGGVAQGRLDHGALRMKKGHRR